MKRFLLVPRREDGVEIVENSGAYAGYGILVGREQVRKHLKPTNRITPMSDLNTEYTAEEMDEYRYCVDLLGPNIHEEL